MCRKPRLGTESDFNHLDFFVAIFFSGPNFVFKKVRFWRSYEFPSVIGTSVVKSYCPNCLYFWGDFLGEGVNDSICVENLDLAPKMTSTISCCGNMIIGLPRQTLPPLLAPGGPSLEKKLNFLASWAFSKFHGFFGRFWSFGRWNRNNWR